MPSTNFWYNLQSFSTKQNYSTSVVCPDDIKSLWRYMPSNNLLNVDRDGRISSSTSDLIQGLLKLDSRERLTAEQVMESLRGIVSTWWVFCIFWYYLHLIFRL